MSVLHTNPLKMNSIWTGGLAGLHGSMALLAGAFFFGVCMFSLCMHGFSPGALTSPPEFYIDPRSVSLHGCFFPFSLCGPVMDW